MLLDQVHQLASFYHWSEGEILGLGVRRRLAYLLLIERQADERRYGGGRS